MKVYITSVGEKTTDICVSQLVRFGFDVVLLDKKESWIDKYKRFIQMADEDCLRIDADVIVNKNICIVKNVEWANEGKLMVSFLGWCFYKNDIGIISPIYYSKECLAILKKNIDKLNKNRPETSAWRLPEIVDRTYHSNIIIGIHGVCQYQPQIDMAIENKKDRKQINDYDFDLAIKLSRLWKN